MIDLPLPAVATREHFGGATSKRFVLYFARVWQLEGATALQLKLSEIRCDSAPARRYGLLAIELLLRA